jgi:hypothetical protein
LPRVFRSQVRASDASMHTSATANRSVIILGFFHGDLLHSLDVADPITEDIDDLDVLNIRDSVPDIAEIFHIVSETLIMLLPDGL